MSGNSKKVIDQHFRRLGKRINLLDKFIEELEEDIPEGKITEVDFKEIKHLIYLIECQKERLECIVENSQYK